MNTLFRNKFIKLNISSGYSREDPPVPIPNTEVKLSSADYTWWETAWESRTSLVNLKREYQSDMNPYSRFVLWLHGQAVKTPPFHGGIPSSILGGVTILD